MIDSAKALVALINSNTKSKLDSHIKSRGIPVILQIPDIFDGGLKKIKEYSFDEFEIDIPIVSLDGQAVNFKNFKADINSFLLIERLSYQDFEPTTIQEFEALNGGSNAIDFKGNFDNKTCYIAYDKILPIGTLVKFTDFNIVMVISKSEKKIQTNNIIRYTLRRT